MATLNPYLTFNGNCREAMNFYQQCIGGELTLNAVKDTPLADQMPTKYKDQILHSSLKTPELELMATDMQPETLVEGNSNHLCLVCKTEEELRKLWDGLSQDGKINQPLHQMFFGWIGTFTDKFGKRWILECNTEPTN